MSSKADEKRSKGCSVGKELEDRGVILVRWTGRWTIAEKLPENFEDI